MDKNKIYNFITSLRNKIITLSSRTGRIAVSLSINTEGISKKVLDREPATESNISALIRSKIDINNPPDVISVEFTDANKNYIFLDKRQLVIKKPKEKNQDKHNKKEVHLGSVSRRNNRPYLNHNEVEKIFQRKWKEKEREQEVITLRQDVERLENDLVINYKDKGELEARISELEDEIETLEEQLEAKSQLKYYANIIGIALEQIGINKNMLRKPLRGLLEDPEEQAKHIDEKIQDDESGIVTDGETKEKKQLTEEEQRRQEAITLIAQYLAGTDNETLGYIYYIFSEIEADKTIAATIIKYLESIKQK